MDDGDLNSYWIASDTTASITMALDSTEPFNKISIFERQDVINLADGFSEIRKPRLQQYCVDVFRNGTWTTIYLSDETMGDCKVIKLPYSYKAEKVWLKVLKASALPAIYEICITEMNKR